MCSRGILVSLRHLLFYLSNQMEILKQVLHSQMMKKPGKCGISGMWEENIRKHVHCIFMAVTIT